MDLSTPDMAALVKVAWTALWILLAVGFALLLLRAQSRRLESYQGDAPPAGVSAPLAVIISLLGVGFISMAFPYGLLHALLDVLSAAATGVLRLL